MGSKTKDTTEFERAREEIHRQMLSAVSHDLKTPLATIIGSLEVYTRMNEKLSPEKKQALINAALGEAYRLDNFITNILDMAKLEGGMVSIRREKCDLKSLLGDCLTRLGPRAKLHHITIVGDNTRGTLSTDPMLFSRAIGLVLDNAIKHAGKEATIEVHYGREGRNAVVRVQDNGPGIPAGREESIFSKYTRIARSDQQNAGTGLGLAICRLMMQTIGGSVTVANHANGGAVFTLTCPTNE